MEATEIKRQMELLFPDILLERKPGFNYLQVQGRAGSGKTLYLIIYLAAIAARGSTPFNNLHIYLSESSKVNLLKFTYESYNDIFNSGDEITFDAFMKRLTNVCNDQTGNKIGITIAESHIGSDDLIQWIKLGKMESGDLVMMPDMCESSVAESINELRMDGVTVAAIQHISLRGDRWDPDELPFKMDLSVSQADHIAVVGTMMSTTLDHKRALIVRRRDNMSNVTVNIPSLKCSFSDFTHLEKPSEKE